MQIQADSLSIQSLITEFNSEVDEEIFSEVGYCTPQVKNRQRMKRFPRIMILIIYGKK